jgi:hypothetical protein
MDTALLDNYPDAMYPRPRIRKKLPNGRTSELRERFSVIAERACHYGIGMGHTIVW